MTSCQNRSPGGPILTRGTNFGRKSGPGDHFWQAFFAKIGPVGPILATGHTGLQLIDVVYRMRISYLTRMIRYGNTIRVWHVFLYHTRMVVPYEFVSHSIKLSVGSAQGLLLKNKILNKQVEIPILPTIFRPNTSLTRSNNKRFIQLQCHLNCYRNSFFPDAIRIWNTLPQQIIDCSDVDSFRTSIYKYYSY